ncbi:hypothetical protein LCGC14_2377280, partial [marine sediment metagenome]
LYDIATARIRTLAVRQEQSIALQLSIPPWPSTGAPIPRRQLIDIRVRSGAARHFWPADMSVRFEKAGYSGLLGHVSAYGRGGARALLREAGNRINKVLSGIEGSKLALQYRIDAVSALEIKMREIHDRS